MVAIKKTLRKAARPGVECVRDGARLVARLPRAFTHQDDVAGAQHVVCGLGGAQDADLVGTRAIERADEKLGFLRGADEGHHARAREPGLRMPHQVRQESVQTCQRQPVPTHELGQQVLDERVFVQLDRKHDHLFALLPLENRDEVPGELEKRRRILSIERAAADVLADAPQLSVREHLTCHVVVEMLQQRRGEADGKLGQEQRGQALAERTSTTFDDARNRNSRTGHLTRRRLRTKIPGIHDNPHITTA